MSSARLTVKILQILITEFAKTIQNRYINVHYYIQLQIITNTVQRKLTHFTYNSVRYGNNDVTAVLFKLLAMRCGSLIQCSFIANTTILHYPVT